MFRLLFFYQGIRKEKTTLKYASIWPACPPHEFLLRIASIMDLIVYKRKVQVKCDGKQTPPLGLVGRG